MLLKKNRRLRHEILHCHKFMLKKTQDNLNITADEKILISSVQTLHTAITHEK